MTTLRKVMDLVLFMGAARADASPEQLARLRAEVVPLLDEWRKNRVDEAAIRAAVQAIMGAGWTPGPQWQSKW